MKSYGRESTAPKENECTYLKRKQLSRKKQKERNESNQTHYQQNKKGRKEKAKKKEHSKKTFFTELKKDLLLGTAKEPLMVLCNTSFVSNIL